MDPTAAQTILMYFVLPLWLAAGFADYLCHRAAEIEKTSGPKESLLHLLQFTEMAVPTLAAIFLQINALIMLIMIVCLVLHEATAIWDVRYAYETRTVTPTEQHVHSFLEMLPLMGLLIVAILHWQQFLALFGLGHEAADFSLRLKQPSASVALRHDRAVAGPSLRGAALRGGARADRQVSPPLARIVSNGNGSACSA